MVWVLISNHSTANLNDIVKQPTDNLIRSTTNCATSSTVNPRQIESAFPGD